MKNYFNNGMPTSMIIISVMMFYFTSIITNSILMVAAANPTANFVLPNRGSITGGGYINIYGKDLLPSKDKKGGALFDAGIKAKWGVGPNSSISCDPINYLSNDGKIVCVPSALDNKLNGREISTLSNCDGRQLYLNAPPPMTLWVDNVGGPLRHPNYPTASTSLLGKCGGGGGKKNRIWQCSREIMIGSTPILASVVPRAVHAGDLITVYGQTCFGDDFQYIKDEKISLKSDFSMSGEETRDHFGLKSDIIRIRVGKYICETKNSAGRYYRSNKGHVKGRCSSFSSWFQCRLPEGIEPGKYPIQFETVNNGHSITSISGYGFNINNASEAFSVQVLPKSTKKISILNITSVANTNVLRVHGKHLNESNVQIKWGGQSCTKNSIKYNEILCTKSTNTASTGNKYYLGPIAWLREKYVFFKESDMAYALAGEAWSTAIEGFKMNSRPSPGEIMDKLRTGTLKTGYAKIRISSLLPGSHAGTPWEYQSENPSIDLKQTYGRRGAIFQRVSGIYKATHNGYLRMVSRHTAGNLMTVRVCNTVNPDLCYENSDKIIISETLHFNDISVRTPWFQVVKDNSYLIELLVKYNPQHNRKWGGFNVDFDFSYKGNDNDGETAQSNVGYTGPYTPRRARNAQYVLRTSGIAADTITIVVRKGESNIFDLSLANGTVPIPVRGVRFPPRYFRNIIRDSLKWATCDELPARSKKMEVFRYHQIHPFDVEGRWIMAKDTNAFITNSLPKSTKVGGISGASIDYSTSYCGSLSQHINLNAIPDGRVIVPPLSISAHGKDYPYLNFAYKLTPNARVTMLLRLYMRKRFFTCAVLLTHPEPANGVTAHPTCINLQNQIVADGAWHELSFNWRSLLTSESNAFNALFPSINTGVQLMSIAIGAQVHLSSCPSKQDNADTHNEGSGSLSGEMWIDAVSVTKSSYSFNRQKRTETQMAGMVEGKSAVTHIDVDTQTNADKTEDKVTIKLYRTDQCVTSASSAPSLNAFNPVLTVPYRKNRMLPKPSMSFVPRDTSSSRGSGGTINFIYGGITQSISNGNNIANAVSTALGTVLGKVSSKSIVVKKTFDLFDMCGTIAHTVQMSHASNIENPQISLFGTRGGVTAHAMSWSSRNDKINLASPQTAVGMSLSVQVDGNGGAVIGNDVGGVAELVAKDEVSANAGYVRLGGSAQAINVRVQHERGEMQTAVVEDEAGFPIPCTSNAEEDYDETENFVEGAFSGDVQCALAIEEEENKDANFGKNGQTRRRLRHQGLDTKDINDHYDDDDDDVKITSNTLHFPGEDTWAARPTITGEHPLLIPKDQLHNLNVAVPLLQRKYKYGEVVTGVVEKHLKQEMLRRRALSGDEEEVNTNKPSTDSVYELPPGKGNFNDPSTWGGNPVPTKDTHDIVYVPAGFNLTLDTDAYIRVWIIEGRLDFATNKDIHMEGEFIVVNGNDAHFTIGEPNDPYPKQATITMHGHWRSLGLPKFGVKVIAMTSGKMTFYGKEVEPWSLLHATVNAEENIIYVQGDLRTKGWVPNARLLVSSTGYGTERNCRIDRKDKCQTEEVQVQSITIVSPGNVMKVTLKNPLSYTHLGESIAIPGAENGETVERRATVALLDRNINVKGTDVEGFGAQTMMLSGQMVLDYVEFGPFVGQAFQLGRYAVHFHTPNEPLFKNGLQTSNDPKMQGSHQALSRVRGCAIHGSNNRAIAVHGCHFLPVERNIAYNIMGHAMFIEDGIEQHNILKENVVMMVHQAWSLLNTDTTPACFWISNSNNRFIRNRAIGSTHHGYWFDPPGGPTGPSSGRKIVITEFDKEIFYYDEYTKDSSGNPWSFPGQTTTKYCVDKKYCINLEEVVKTRSAPLLQFDNNTASSNGEHGVWIDKIDYKIFKKPNPKSREVYMRRNMYMNNVLAFNNRKEGIGVVMGVGHLQILDAICMGNGVNIGYMKMSASGWATAENNWQGHLIERALIRGDPGRRTMGIGLPHGAWLTVKDTLFSRYIKDLPIHHCLICGGGKGGMEIRFLGTRFVESPKLPRLQFDGYWGSNIIYDMDGKLTNTSKPTWAHSVSGAATLFDGNSPLGHFPPEYCQFSKMVDGVICDDRVSMREVQFRMILPMAWIPIRLQTGPKQVSLPVPYYNYDSQGRRYNWHMTVVVVKTADAVPIVHNMTFLMQPWEVDDPDSWLGEVREMRPNEWTILRIPTLRNPWKWKFGKHASDLSTNDYKQSTYTYNKTAAPLTYTGFVHGQYSYIPVKDVKDFNVIPDPGILDVLISGKSLLDSAANTASFSNVPWFRSWAPNEYWTRYDGKYNAYPICNTGGGCSGVTQLGFGMKRTNCAPGDSVRCLPMGKPANCFSDAPFPEGAKVKRTFKWCDTIPGEWSPPKFGDDVLIKVGWTVILDDTCLETEIVRHLDVYGSLLLRDPGAGKTVKLRAQTIHVAAGKGYLEAGTTTLPISNGNVRLELNGNRYSNPRYGYGLETKYIAVLGRISLVGKSLGDHNQTTWGTLQANAMKGETQLKMESYIFDAWKVDDEIMLGGGHMEDGNTGFDSEDRCKITSVTKVSKHTVIGCEEPFKNDHSGPNNKGDMTFRGAPVTLIHSTNHRVHVVGMEDDTKANSVQQYGVTLQVLATKKGPMGKIGRKAIKNNAIDPESARTREALSAADYVPPKECEKKQGDVIVMNTGFTHCGQRGAQACLAVRPGFRGEFNVDALVKQGIASVAMIKHSTFSDAYFTGIVVTASGVIVEDNAVTNTYNGGLSISGSNNKVINNAAIKIFNDMYSMFHDMGAVGMALKGNGIWKNNAVSLSQYTGFQLGGRPCGVEDKLSEASGFLVYWGGQVGVALMGGEEIGYPREPAEAYPETAKCREWRDIEVQGANMFGVQSSSHKNKCVRLNRLALWDTGLGVSLWLSNGDSGRGSRSNSGAFAEIADSTIVGSNSRCRNDGIAFPNFYAGTKPYRPSQGVETPSRYGGSIIKNVKFVDFGTCNNGKGQNYAMVNNMARARYAYVYHDVANSVEISGLSFENTPEDNKLKMLPPPKGRIGNMKWGCAQIYCDGDRSLFIVDKDGSLLGNEETGTLVPFNELGWKEKLTYVDALGRETMESLIPYTAQWRVDGSRIVPLQGADKLYDEAGILREGCTFQDAWQAYKCPNAEHRQIVFESLDRDHKMRRLSPTSVLTRLNDKRYMALYTGPGRYKIEWSGAIKRSVTLWVTGHKGATHEVHHTSTNPGIQRVGMSGATMNDAVHIKLYYGVANNVDLYVNEELVPPLAKVTFENPDGPDLSNRGTLSDQPHGANYYDRLNGYMEFVLRGPQPVVIRISNMIVLTGTITVTEDEFFVPGLLGLTRNIALLLGIDESRIAVAGVGDYKDAKEKASVGHNRRRLANEPVTLDFVITETKRGELSQNTNGETSTSAEEALMAESGKELNNFGKQLIDTPEAELTKNTQVQIVQSFKLTQEASVPTPGWYGCEVKAFKDGICDCNCGRWDPDCDDSDTNQDAEVDPRGCPSSIIGNLTHHVEALREFCVNYKDSVICENVEEFDLCEEWPCQDKNVSVELRNEVARATSFASVCKKTNPSDPLPSEGYVNDGKCALIFKFDAVEKEEIIDEKKNESILSNLVPKTIGGWIVFLIVVGIIVFLIAVTVWYFKVFKPKKKKEVKSVFSAFQAGRRAQKNGSETQIDDTEINSNGIEMMTSSNKKNLAVGGTSSAVVALVMDGDDNERNKEKVVETI